MLDSAGVGRWVAQIVFWVLIVTGWRELGPTRRVVFVGLWVFGFVCRDYVAYGASIFTAYVAVLAIVLVLMIYKRDITLY